ncbi:hypothetical protein QNO07_11580 [Streptomyces sp. 549]|uniref:hypothetical protein n=1 Tax=Streptomyces sp. 549 TaxID=3049076 RepID=UPI0024C405F5|nr:hypothetical protein [Streptomyces sp. 549]MDK1474049.1 hypothetical protein [Streptomyces sp. 549]
MRARVLAAAGGAVLLAATLSGCLTVHGERAVVPAVDKAEARQVLKEYVRDVDKAQRTFDADLSARVERGGLGEIEHAALRARKAVAPDGNPDHEPLELSAPRFHIPRQAGWPKYFLVDAAAGPDSRRLLAFTREGVDEKWKAAYSARLAPGDVPEFATDADGHALPVTGSGGSEDGDGKGDGGDGKGDGAGEGGKLLADPGELSAAYTGYLQDGRGSTFADGPQTSERRATRARSANRPAARNEWADLPASSKQYPPMGLYTEDGSALVFFTSHHQTKQTVASGYTPKVRPLVKPLLKGEPKQWLTQVFVTVQAVVVPPDDAAEDQVRFLDQRTGLVSAEGG